MTDRPEPARHDVGDTMPSANGGTYTVVLAQPDTWGRIVLRNDQTGAYFLHQP